MKFFMLSKCGEGAGLLHRLLCEGNDVSIKIQEKDYSSVYEGIIDRAKEPEEDAIVLVDSSGMGEEADHYKAKGFKVIGGSVFADKLELSRDFGLNFMRTHDIKVPKTKKFDNFTDGIKFVESNKDKKLVFKPSGNLPCKLTYCSEDSEDLVSYMKFVRQYYGSEIDDFILQEYLDGPTISTEFWVSPKGFLLPANHTVEVKKFLNDNLGPSTGCQGNLVWLAEDDDIVENLFNIENDLVKEGFVGCIDLNCIICDGVPYGLEWTPRFGLDAMPSLLQMIDDVGKFLTEVADGTVRTASGFDSDFSGGVRLTIPPYPAEPENLRRMSKELPNVGVPIRGLESPNSYFYEVMCKDGELIHSAGTGVIAVVSDSGDDPEECFNVPYQILKNAKIPDKQYRTDLGKVLPEMYANAMEALEYEVV